MPKSGQHHNHPTIAENSQLSAARSAQDFDRDLHPNALAGQNSGFEGTTAADIKEAGALLHGFTTDELRTIPILPVGTRLEQGATYLDLMDRGYGPFHGQAGMEARSDHYYVPKKALDYVTWNRLTGVTKPDRLDEAADTDQ